MQNLKRDVLDVVQIHNATVEILNDGGLLQALVKAKEKGLLRFIGCSVYQVNEALAGIHREHLVGGEVRLRDLVDPHGDPPDGTTELLFFEEREVSDPRYAAPQGLCVRLQAASIGRYHAQTRDHDSARVFLQSG